MYFTNVFRVVCQILNLVAFKAASILRIVCLDVSVHLLVDLDASVYLLVFLDVSVSWLFLLVHGVLRVVIENIIPLSVVVTASALLVLFRTLQM